MNLDVQELLIQVTYFVVALLFILGLKKMSSPMTAHRGVMWAGIGMVIATLITYFHHEINQNYIWMTVAIGIGGLIAFISAKKAAVTDMPKMIALYNAMGGGAVAAIAVVELIKQAPMSDTARILAVAGILFGTIALSGSFIAFARLQGIISGVIRYPMQHWVSALVLVITLTFGLAIIINGSQYEMSSLIIFFLLALVLGALIAVPVDRTDMSIVISLYNILTGLAVGFVGYVLDNPAMMIVGIVAASASALLTKLMVKSMNRPASSALFGHFNQDHDRVDDRSEFAGNIKTIDSTDVAVMMAFAEKVIVVPGYGMAVAQAQYKIREMVKLLQERGVNVKFAIHPVAGRMPGHMNVLLAEAGVPYETINDLDEINDEFARTDVVLVIGANDVINPAARTDSNSPIYGMPILNSDYAKNVIVVKRGDGSGFSGIENQLFFSDNTRMLYGDGQTVISDLVTKIKAL